MCLGGRFCGLGVLKAVEKRIRNQSRLKRRRFVRVKKSDTRFGKVKKREERLVRVQKTVESCVIVKKIEESFVRVKNDKRFVRVK